MNYPRPQSDEKEFEFTKRCHAALKDSVPDFTDRNKVVWGQWDKYGAPSNHDRIASKLLPDRYVPLKGEACYFVEHETPGPDGQPRKFGFNDLKEIAENCNFDVVERGKFSIISDDHTTDGNEQQPQALGVAVRYRLGILGTEKPIWAVFAQERACKDKLDRLVELPRRSVELLTDKRTGRRVFDPIAALGSRAPRLAMPGRYSQNEFVERYSFAGAMAPGGSNTALEKFSGENGHVPLSNEDIRQVVDAIQALPVIQWATMQMGAMNTPPAGGPAGPMGAPPPGAVPPGGPPPDAAPGGDSGGGEPPASPPGGEGGDDDQGNKFTVDPSYVERFDMTERYAMLARENAEIRKTIADQATMLSALSNGKIDAERREALSGLATKYPGLVVADEEFSKCLFSAGSKMTNDDFKTHIETIERFSTRAALVSTQRLPTGVMPTPGKSHDPKDDPTSERYAARCKQAIERHTADMNAGKPMRDFDTILSEVP